MRHILVKSNSSHAGTVYIEVQEFILQGKIRSVFTKKTALGSDG